MQSAVALHENSKGETYALRAKCSTNFSPLNRRMVHSMLRPMFTGVKCVSQTFSARFYARVVFTVKSHPSSDIASQCSLRSGDISLIPAPTIESPSTRTKYVAAGRFTRSSFRSRISAEKRQLLRVAEGRVAPDTARPATETPRSTLRSLRALVSLAAPLRSGVSSVHSHRSRYFCFCGHGSAEIDCCIFYHIGECRAMTYVSIMVLGLI